MKYTEKLQEIKSLIELIGIIAESSNGGVDNSLKAKIEYTLAKYQKEMMDLLLEDEDKTKQNLMSF